MFTEYVDTGFDGVSRYRLTLRPWLWQLGLTEWRSSSLSAPSSMRRA